MKENINEIHTLHDLFMGGYQGCWTDAYRINCHKIFQAMMLDDKHSCVLFITFMKDIDFMFPIIEEVARYYKVHIASKSRENIVTSAGTIKIRRKDEHSKYEGLECSCVFVDELVTFPSEEEEINDS